MSHTPHALADDFPEHVARIHDLRETDAHFRKLSDAYHDTNRAVHRAETQVDPMEAQYETELRKRRMRLKDEIAAILSAA